MAGAVFQQWYARFETTRHIDPVHFGMTRADLVKLFGPPNYAGATSRKYRVPAILVYEGLEFHFEQVPSGPGLFYRHAHHMAQPALDRQPEPR